MLVCLYKILIINQTKGAPAVEKDIKKKIIDMIEKLDNEKLLAFLYELIKELIEHYS